MYAELKKTYHFHSQSPVTFGIFILSLNIQIPLYKDPKLPLRDAY